MAFIKKHPAWLVLPLAGWLLWRFWSRKKEGRRMFGTERPPYAVDIYRQMLKRLEAHGIRKAESSTHLEFLNRLTGLPPEKEEAVRTITRFYEQIRFGDGPVSAKDKRRIQLAIQQI
ncbi:MAG: DUF4129 domain-containing protein [Nitrospinaceae bacterium]|nr:DUF4129 domain-containing protein [Nitrospinaceae bacterium]NIR55808.1 DUF4129 domain-containing protein [Nitrospinaceae bacterium]NIS86261.1 DUF4129 domain-containing protein [Nitrospinaceae bacterium]NIT83090.1 DUF4129 domain-containing protein [Nitrospinaceae bacterium]NIU45300.1 DUF4129 domain-containing protein [Nitrospinaceae bacterium]